MAKRVDLAAELGKILTEYGDEIADNVKDATRQAAKAGVKTVKANAQNDFGGTGKYARGWTSQVEENQYSAQGIIYNKAAPGLPHLLENGHAMRNGGRVPGRAHIKPVEEELVKSFEMMIREAI